ncbi:MAG: aldehyde dehydrogenase family protein [Burkholderiales bacterium]|nr:aldehyde dehydrogenase family protein [Burkholderiales bacterium]
MNTQAPQANNAVDFAQTVARLRAGFHAGKTRSYEQRIALLKTLIRMLEENESAILQAVFKDLRKPGGEAWGAEFAGIRKEAQYAIKNLKRWMKPIKVRTPILAQPGKSWLQPDPLGVILIIGAWNFPFQVCLVPIIGAIAAGNTVLLKPSEMSADSSRLFAEMIPKYFSSDVCAVVEGGAAETQALLEQRFDHICYTGGGNVGKIVMMAAAKHLTPVTLELGGKSPCIIDKSANIQASAKRVVWGKWQNSGQVCIAPDTMFVHESVKDQFVKALKEEVRKAFGDNVQASPDFGRIINERHYDRMVKYLDDGRIVWGGKHDRSDRFMEPTLIENVPLDSSLGREEIFGPILILRTFRDAQEVIDYYKGEDKPLALYVFANSNAAQRQFVDNIAAGNVCVNDTWMFMLVPGLPFGGVGASGMGAYTGDQGFENFTHFKPVLKRGFWPDFEARYAPHNEKKAKFMARAWK